MRPVLLYLLRAVLLVIFNLELFALLELFIRNTNALFLAWSCCIGISGALYGVSWALEPTRQSMRNGVSSLCLCRRRRRQHSSMV